MKKTIENRYPNSAKLFRFCKEALEIRYQRNVKVIDQDVGAILGYDPADCGHWKKGKKNIRGLLTLQSIADHLSVDERLVFDITAGKIDLEEAVFEYSGYGSFYLRGAPLETLKKEYFRNPKKWRKDSSISSFEEIFSVDRSTISALTNSILDQGSFLEAPIFVPEIFSMFPSICLKNDESMTESIKVSKQEVGGLDQTVVSYKSSDMRPYIRFNLLKELYKHLCAIKHNLVSHLCSSPKEVIEVQSNIFAGLLLIPSNFLKAEVERVDSSKDIVQQLAKKFWVSKSLLNKRLADFIDNGN